MLLAVRRRYACNVCSIYNEVPVEYFCPLDDNNRRRDIDERAELCTGTVEYVAPQEYMVRPSEDPPLAEFRARLVFRRRKGALKSLNVDCWPMLFC